MKRVYFQNGNVTENIIQTALPMLVAQLLQLLYNIVDRIYIARIPGVGTAALGGVGLVFPVIVIITAFTNLFGSGGSPLFAIALGEENREKAALYQNLVFTLEIVTGVILTGAGLLLGKPILYFFGASAGSLTYALPYLRIYMLGTVFSMLTTGLNPFITAQGFAAFSMITVVTGAGINAVLDPVMIFLLHLGVQGAALATVLAQGISFLVLVRFFRSDRAYFRLHLLKFRRMWEAGKEIREICLLGLASFVMQITNSLVQVVSNRVLQKTGGDLYISVMTILSSIRQMLETPILAIADGASPVLSFNYGAKKYRLVEKAIWVLFSLLTGYALLIWLCIRLWPGFFIGIFSSDKTLDSDAVHALGIYFSTFIFMVFQYTGQTVFKALNRKKQAIFFSIFRKVIIVVPLTIVLPFFFHLGTDGVFAAEPVSNVIGGLACFITMCCTVIPSLKGGRCRRESNPD